MKTLLWHPSALRDLQRLHLFIAKENPHAALEALQKIKKHATTLKEFPDIGIKLSHEQRELHIPFGHGTYILRYCKKDPNTLIIVNIWHSREQRN